MKNDGASEIFCFDEEQLSNTFTDIEVISSAVNSVVLRAKRDGQWWTLKAIAPGSENLEIRQNLQQKEYDIQSSLQHAHIAKAYGLEFLPGYGRCIVLEWVDGMNLRQWLETAKPNKRERKRVMNQLIDAVSYMHANQVVHRDLKPDNVMITRNGENVKLIDFGLADRDQYANLKQPSGTPGYMAPEQNAERDTDCRNDIYSLGCIVKDLHLGRIYDKMAQRCTLPKEDRLSSMSEVKHFLRLCKRWRNAMIIALVLVLVGFAARGCYLLQEYNGRPYYEEVAQFRVANIKYTSWGGLVASAKLEKMTERQVVVPATVSDGGLRYRVIELGFDSFKDDTLLQKLAVMCETDTINILKGSFKGCTQMRDLYLFSPKLVGIGSFQWPCKLTDIFDEHHFSDVTIYVPESLIPIYRKSVWGRFKNIKAIKKNED